MTRHRWWAWAAALAALLLVGGPEACRLAWRARHPSPLGRTTAEVELRLAWLLPPGTSLDSVAARLERAGVDFSVDSLAPAGTALVGMARNIDADLFCLHGAQLRLEFDRQRRLTRRLVEHAPTCW